MIDARTLSTKVDWDKLRIFNQVAWSGSLKKASDKLALSQSAISRHISGLEQTMGCQLFRRSPKGLLLTEQGVTLFDTTQEIFGRISHTLSTLKETKDTAVGHLRIATTQSFATFWLSNHISKFLDQYPDIRLSHLISSEETDVLHDVADVAVRSAQTTQLRLIERNIMTSPCRIYASKKYLETHGTPARADELDNHRLIVYGNKGAQRPQSNFLLHIGLSEEEPRRIPYYTVNSNMAILNVLEQNKGISVLPEFIAKTSPSLIPILPNLEVPPLTYYLVYPEELRRSKKISAFRDFLIENLKNLT